MNDFRAYRIHQEGRSVRAGLERMSVAALTEGEVLVRVQWSDINFKDALAATGAGRILRRPSLNGGIDAAGRVVDSSDPRFSPGDEVVITGGGLGETLDGGFAELLRAPADIVIPLPEGLSARDAMAIGTAGFTAALAVHQLQRMGQRPAGGPIAVTGATGGVGSLAIDMLAGLGFEVHAVTGKAAAADYLRGLGASEVLLRDDIDPGSRPLESIRFAGAVDNLGGAWLAWLTRCTGFFGSIASIGLAAGAGLETTVMPFILRGVNLLGINSVETPRALRVDIWTRLAEDLRPRHLEDIVTAEVGLDGLGACFEAYLAAGVVGRTLVRIGGESPDGR
ncbi:MAG: acryloyl-CoA reductase [Gammaproteobacteria bacterium]|nr:MAG: acryloyl-CoA reductase [Gammaproteobacteria bacterium]